jgi:plasmid stabilization system protein ParE
VTGIQFHQGAAQELRAAARYYELQVVGLGVAFIAEVERTVALMLENPAIGATTWQHYRRMVVRRFPFTVIYRPREDTLFVVAVAHHHRQPNYWKGRA